MVAQKVKNFRVTRLANAMLFAAVCLTGCKNRDAGTASDGEPTQVRAITVASTGAVNRTFSSVPGESAYVIGTCNSKIFANFGIEFRPDPDHKVRAVLMSKDSIQPGQVGSFPLTRLSVDFIDETVDFSQTEYAGKGELEISTHDSTPGKLRMAGIMRGKGLLRNDEAAGQAIDVEVPFDINFACTLPK